ncbi:hypothetical protein F7725_019718 [Dissostichus mawsoni]|uniref:Uncharacterized protein n=1 Tax=Dissostichus mawsoni TaxID=36200 RepID=A0A7J5YMM0_DISMA|nr:hypothetical protein F7725_019718 [Dissostichus mawsoni]
MELKPGPNSPHIHTGFPGVAGKYVYCPANVLSLYRDQGMEKQMTWKNLKESVFYEAEKKRCFFDDSKSDFQQVLKMNPDFEDAKVSLKQTLLDQQRKIDRGY